MTETRHNTISPDGPQRSVKAFIIHLARATDRRAQVTRLIESLAIERLSIKAEVIDAVDGKTLSPEMVARVYRRSLHRPRYPFALGINEIACFLSHRKAWQAIIDQNLDVGLVLEDDVELTAQFPAAFEAALQVADSNSFIRLPFNERESGREVFSSKDVRVIEPVPVGLRMMAQLIGRDAARQLLAVTQTFDRPVDTLAQMNWVTGLKPLSVLPGGINEISSQLGGTTIQHKKSFSDKMKREILRPFYRMQVRRFSAKS